jgi:hypothetical protein
MSKLPSSCENSLANTRGTAFCPCQKLKLKTQNRKTFACQHQRYSLLPLKKQNKYKSIDELRSGALYMIKIKKTK